MCIIPPSVRQYFLSYEWGVYTCAYAHKYMYTFIHLRGKIASGRMGKTVRICVYLLTPYKGRGWFDNWKTEQLYTYSGLPRQLADACLHSQTGKDHKSTSSSRHIASSKFPGGKLPVEVPRCVTLRWSSSNSFHCCTVTTCGFTTSRLVKVCVCAYTCYN